MAPPNCQMKSIFGLKVILCLNVAGSSTLTISEFVMFPTYFLSHLSAEEQNKGHEGRSEAMPSLLQAMSSDAQKSSARSFEERHSCSKAI